MEHLIPDKVTTMIASPKEMKACNGSEIEAILQYLVSETHNPDMMEAMKVKAKYKRHTSFPAHILSHLDPDTRS